MLRGSQLDHSYMLDKPPLLHMSEDILRFLCPYFATPQSNKQVGKILRIKKLFKIFFGPVNVPLVLYFSVLFHFLIDYLS